MDQATSLIMRPKRNKSEMANRVERSQDGRVVTMVEAIPLIYRTLGNVDPELCDKVVGVILTAKNDEELDICLNPTYPKDMYEIYKFNL